jgi:GNAT superfamily N-acetyltransferase
VTGHQATSAIIHIDYLADHPDCIPTLARWHHEQWAHLSPGGSVERRITLLDSHLGRGQIPTTFVAVSTQAVVGSASLIAYDMDTRLDLSPWLASVYVKPEHRRQGIGSALVCRVIQEAKELGVDNLYLYTTPDKDGFYARFGWVLIDRTLYRGYDQIVMALPIAR